MKKFVVILALSFGLVISAFAQETQGEQDEDWNTILIHYMDTDEVIEEPEGWEVGEPYDEPWENILEHYQNTDEVEEPERGIDTPPLKEREWEEILEHY